MLSARISYRLHYINAVTTGQTGPELGPNLKPEIDALWAEVKRLPAEPMLWRWPMSDEMPIGNMAAARNILREKLNGASSAQGRRKTQRKLNAAVDRSSLRASGRTDQLNFHCSTELKERVKRAAYAHSMPIAELMENALLAYLEAVEKENP